MPNLRRCIVGPLDDLGDAFVGARGVFLRASDGTTVVVLRAQILAHFAAETGTLLQRRVATRLWLRDQIVAGLGAGQIDPAGLANDFDTTTGEVTDLQVS